LIIWRKAAKQGDRTPKMLEEVKGQRSLGEVGGRRKGDDHD
jgi:hypothetical protein